MSFPSSCFSQAIPNFSNMPNFSRQLVLKAPIKVNLALHILAKRPDGYHDLESLVAFSGDGDILSLELAKKDSFTINGTFAAKLPADGNNLVVKARDALREYFKNSQKWQENLPALRIALDKKIPVAAGLGGGSSDAAACLFGYTGLIGGKKFLHQYKAELFDLASQLGADVPMCLAWFYQQFSYIAQGKGELLTPLSQFPSLPLVILNSGVALSTARIFKNLTTSCHPPLPLQKLQQLHDLPSTFQLLKTMRNDLYAPALALAPNLADDLKLLANTGACYWAMSGSGASCFGIYKTFAQAKDAAALIAQKQPESFVLASQTDGCIK